MLKRLWRQLGRIRTRLLIVNLLVLLVPVAGLEFARLYERQLLGALERDMKNQAVLVREMCRRDLDHTVPLGEGGHEASLQAAARHTRTRIRVLDREGTIVVDSHRLGPPEGPEPPAPQVLPEVIDQSARRIERRAWDMGEPEQRWPQPADRKEVVSAMAGNPDTHARIRDRAPSVVLFLAEPIRHEGRVVGVVYVTRSTQPVLVELHRIRTGLIQVLMVALAFTVLVTLTLSWSISSPLARLARAARRIARGERDTDVPIGGGVEIRELGQAFRTMTARLDARVRYISEFSADVAHEFKSPLTSIRGAAELLGEGAFDDDEARVRFLRNIELDADRLDRLVSRLLELSRIETDRAGFERFDLSACVERVVARTHTAEQPVGVAGGCDAERYVLGHESDVERALLNLVENAVRFSPAGRAVTIGVECDHDHLALRVSDEGPGVDEAYQDRIFDRFFTTDQERSGTGLGLAIVKTVAEAHGGSVQVTRSGSEGATFTILLPIRLSSAPRNG